MKNISVCAAVNSSCVLKFTQQNQSFNSESFLELLKELCVLIENKRMGSVVLICDNVPFHKVIHVNNFVASKRHRLLFLPPYSPFLNPIENLSSKCKVIIKNFRCNNQEELNTAIATAVTEISEQDCQNYYRNMFSFLCRCLRGEDIIDE
jgi:transposase